MHTLRFQPETTSILWTPIKAAILGSSTQAATLPSRLSCRDSTLAVGGTKLNTRYERLPDFQIVPFAHYGLLSVLLPRLPTQERNLAFHSVRVPYGFDNRNKKS